MERERVVRYGVHVRRASGLPDDVDSLVKVKIESHSQSTYAVEEERNPEWNQLFTFEVKKPNESKVKFKVVDSKRFRPAKTLGKAEAYLVDLHKYNSKEEVSFVLRDKNNKPRGTLYVSFYHQQPQLDKLKVLCATWNVGNAAPPKDLAMWLKDCKTGAYDLIAVGAQECQFSKERTTTTTTGLAFNSLLSSSLSQQLSSLGGDSTDMDDTYHDQTSLLQSSPGTTPSATPTCITPAITPVPTPTARGLASNPEAPWPDQDGGNTPNLMPSPRKDEEQADGAMDYTSPFHISRDVYETIIASEDVALRATQVEVSTGPAQASWNADLVPSMTSLQVTTLESVAARLTKEQGEVEFESAADTCVLEATSLEDGDAADASWDGATQQTEPPALLPPLPPRPGWSKEDGQPTTPGGGGPENRRYKKSTGTILKKIGHRIYYGSGALSFEEVVTEAVGDQYVLVDRKNMGQVRLLVFARFDIRNAVEWTESKSEGTGVASVGTNKGGVGVALRVANTNICFVSAHLAAHQSKIAEREKDYKEIVDGLQMDEYQMDAVTGYHHTIFMGDLNYRIDFKTQKSTQSDTPTPDDFEDMVRMIKNKQYSELFKDDQLKQEMEREHVFVGFKEAPINFAPTFKMLRKELQDYDTKRLPAWCDRVLALSTLPRLQAEFQEYYSVPELTTSDHKPVAAILSLPVVVKTLAAGRGKDPANPERLRYSVLLRTLTLTCSMKHLVEDSVIGPSIRIFSPAFDGDGSYEAKLRLDTDTSIMPSIREPIEMKLLQGPVDEMEHDRLMIRVLSNFQGGRASIGRAVLPLYDAVEKFKTAPGEAAEFKIRLLDNGVDVGDLKGTFLIIKSTNSLKSQLKPPLIQEGSRDLNRSAPYPPPAGSDPAPVAGPSPSPTLQVFAAVSNENAAAVAFAMRTNTLTSRAVSNSLSQSLTSSLLGDEVPMSLPGTDSRTGSMSSLSEAGLGLDISGSSESDKSSRLKRNSTPHQKPLPSILL